MTPAETRSVAELLSSLADNEARYLFFWGHRPKVPDHIDKSCLSNWFAAPFEVDGSRYLTTEHYMMCGKALLFDDVEIHSQIMAAASPGAAKALGRKVRNFDETIWRQHRFRIVVEGNVAKFGQNPKLTDYLIRTGSSVLVEASPYDRIWGIGMEASNPGARNPSKWRGINLLGFALMEVRDVVKNG